MLDLFLYLLELKKELIISFIILGLYVVYYLLEVVKVPQVAGCGELTALVRREVAVARQPYWPTPWCVEARLQTCVGALLRSWALPAPRWRREVVRLADGGSVALDWLRPERGAGRRAVLLVLPGLTGGPHADYVRAVCAAAAPLRADAVVFSNRGQAGVPLTSPRLYSAVSDGDLAEVVEHVRAACPGAPVLGVGVSLGGVILARYLARRGARAALAGALAVSAPLDVEASAAAVERPLNAPLGWHMARCLRRTLRAHAALAADWCGAAHARSVRQFDAAFTARHFGFESAEAYYRAATLRGRLGAVRAPLLSLCAADDPLQPARALRALAAEAAAGGRVVLLTTARGGHIGFLEGWWPAGAPGDQLLARVTQQYFDALLRHPHLLHRPEPGPEPAASSL